MLEIDLERRLLIFSTHYHSFMITILDVLAKKEKPYPGMINIQDSMTSISGRVLGPCMFPRFYNQYYVLDRPLSPVLLLCHM